MVTNFLQNVMKITCFVNTVVDLYHNRHSFAAKRTCCLNHPSKSIIGPELDRMEKVIYVACVLHVFY